VRSDQLQVGAADGGHPDEVVGTVKNAANVLANGTHPRACMPRADAIICCSAM
jgi:hypothetical protein